MKASTGIEPLDAKLSGGFERPSCLLLFSENMAEKRVFAEQFVIAGMRGGETCLYVDFYRAPKLTRRDLGKFGAFEEGRLVMVDATSCQTVVSSDERFQLKDAEDLGQMEEVLIQALRETGATRAVLDSLDFITERFPLTEALGFLSQLVSEARAQNCILTLLYVNWSSRGDQLKLIREKMNYLVDFKTKLRGGILMNSLKIRHNVEGGIDTKWIPFAFKEGMGLVVYFPRILVTGPPSAGKSTLIGGICNTLKGVNRVQPARNVDYGRVDIGGMEVELVGAPSGEGLQLASGAGPGKVNGVLLLVDSSDPDSFASAPEVRRVTKGQLPVVVAANKADIPGAVPVPEVRRLLGLGPGIPVVPTSALSGLGVEEALGILVDLIVGVGG